MILTSLKSIISSGDAASSILMVKALVLPWPPYSPDLAFSKLEEWLGEKRFESNDKIIARTNAYFENLIVWKG